MANAFPLEWPKGWTRAESPRRAKFKTAVSKAHLFLREELYRLGAQSIVISTNVPLKADGNLRIGEPVDPGAAVYFLRDGQQMVLACDQYDYLADNLQAIAKTVEAMRGIERWGAGEMMDRAFSGFKGLPATASQGEDCWKVLSLPPMSDARMVTLSHRDMTRKLHAEDAPSEAFSRVNVARDDAMRALAATERVPA